MNGERKKTIAVIHPFQQHSFKTAVAIKNSGYNVKYVTTVYDKKGSFTRFGKSLLRGENRKRAEKRKTEGLLDQEIVLKCEILELLLLVLQRIDKKRYLYNKTYHRVLKYFAKSTFKYLKKEQIKTIIVYDIVSADLIRLIRSNKMDITVILDMSAPYYNYMEKQFIDDISINPQNHELTEKNLAEPLQAYKKEYSYYEINNADYFFVASTFTRKSLLESGVDKDKIFTCRYGIDDFSSKEEVCSKDYSQNRPLRVMYAGNINRQKGAYQLIRVANSLPFDKYDFSFYGRYQIDDAVYNENKNKFSFRGHIPRDDMKKAYRNADVLVFPTLADGFGFVTVEALSYGLPVIASSNAGSSDLIQNGENGFVYQAGDDKELRKLLMLFESERNLLKKMRAMCIASVQNITWKQYYEDVNKSLKEIIHDN